MLTSTEVLRYTAFTTFRPFSKGDWDAFSGVESTNPLIGEFQDYIIIIDGDVVSVVDTEGQEDRFLLAEECW